MSDKWSVYVKTLRWSNTWEEIDSTEVRRLFETYFEDGDLISFKVKRFRHRHG